MLKSIVVQIYVGRKNSDRVSQGGGLFGGSGGVGKGCIRPRAKQG